ncbi:fumarate hydratase [Candidatus Micrarchaeota archaeon]|nr:fumarate hydratase [Candidatus Micrarchaeota archaeon]MBU2477150.1 fumarate hydratase [Candidatus Micrarchaeota archaeon]
MRNFTQAIVELYKLTTTFLPEDVKEKLRQVEKESQEKLEKKVMTSILENIKIAEKKGLPLCEDTGIPIFFIYYSKEFSQKEIKKSVLDATKTATEKNFLRPNAVDSLTQKNSGNCIGKGIPTIYFEEWEKDFIEVNLLLKGGGSENIGRTYSLPNPELNAGRDLDGIKKCVLDAVVKAQGLGCPPTVVSVVVGGSKDVIAVESKKQLLEKLEVKQPFLEKKVEQKTEKNNELKEKENNELKKEEITGEKKDQKLEKEIQEFNEDLLKKINSLGIGPMGLGGKNTVLEVKTKFLARHPASFFVEVSFCCWADRRHTLKWENGEAHYD